MQQSVVRLVGDVVGSDNVESRVDGDACVGGNPVADPTQPHSLDPRDARGGQEHQLSRIGDFGIDRIHQAPIDVPGRPPKDDELVGYAEILHDLSEDFPPEAVHFLEKIRKAADNLTAMVDAVTILADLQTSNRPRGGLGEYTAARDEVAQSSASARRTIANSPGAHRRTRP